MARGAVPGVPCRYVFACVASFGTALQYAMKVNLSVAIVAMVQSATLNTNGTSAPTKSGSCPSPSSNATGGGTTYGEFSWDEEVQGHILSAYFYGYLSSQLLGGILAQRFGGRYIFGPAIFVCGILALVSPAAARQNVYIFITVRVLQGFASGMVLPTAQNLISRWYPRNEQSLFSSIIFSGCNAGTLVGMALTGVLVQAAGWPMVFYFFGGLAVVWFFPWLYFVYSSPEDHPGISQKEKDYIADGRSWAEHSNKESPSVPWISILTSRPVWAYILYDMSFAWTNYLMLSDLPTYLKNVLHYDVQQSGIISASPYLFAWLSAPAAGWLAQKIRAKNIISQSTSYNLFNGISSFGSGLSLVGMALVGCDSTAVLVLVCTTVAASYVALGGSYFNNLDLSPNFTGPLMGVNYTCLNLLGVITPVVVGVMTKGNQTLDRWATIFYIATGISVLGYFIYFFFGSVEAQKWNNPEKKEAEKTEDPRKNIP